MAELRTFCAHDPRQRGWRVAVARHVMHRRAGREQQLDAVHVALGRCDEQRRRAGGSPRAVHLQEEGR